MSAHQIYPKSEPMTAHFTGQAYVHFLVSDADGLFHCQVYDVLFEPGCLGSTASCGSLAL